MQDAIDPAKHHRPTIRDYKPSARHTFEAKWPGSDKPLTLLYLTCGEQQAAYFAARDHFDRVNQPVDDVGADQFELEVTYQQIARMLLQPGARNPKSTLLASADEARDELTPNEARHMVELHWEEQQREAAAWSARATDPLVRQLARVLGMDERSDPDTLLERVMELRRQPDAPADVMTSAQADVDA